MVPPIHCAIHCVSVDRPMTSSAVLTCSAVVMQRGSSMPMSHWWSAATVQVASRCSFGRQVSSKSPMAPPASSNSHAARCGSAPRHRRDVEKVLTAPNGRVCELHHSAVDDLVRQGRDEGRAEEPLPSGCASERNSIRCECSVKTKDSRRTLSAEDLCDAVLLVEEALLVHLVQQAALAVPARDRLGVLDTALARARVAHLDHHERVLIRRPRSEEYVCVEFARSILDAVAEVLDQRWRRRTVEPAARVSAPQWFALTMHSLDEVTCEDDRDWKRARLISRGDPKRRARATHSPPQL